MSEDLEFLIEKSKILQPSSDEREQQRRSFVYGNCAFENSLITREMIDQEAEKLKRENTQGVMNG